MEVLGVDINYEEYSEINKQLQKSRKELSQKILKLMLVFFNKAKRNPAHYKSYWLDDEYFLRFHVHPLYENDKIFDYCIIKRTKNIITHKKYLEV